MQYHYYVPRESPLTDGQFTLAARYQSSDYDTLSPFTTPIPHASLWNYQAQYSQSLGECWFAGVGYSQQLSRRQIANGDVQSDWWLPLGRIYADVTLDHNSGTPARASGRRSSVSALIWDTAIIFSPRYDTSTHTSRSEWQYTPADNVESVSSSSVCKARQARQEYYGNLNYAGRRAEFSHNQDAFSAGENRTSLRWGTALVYADGEFGISPARAGFVCAVQEHGKFAGRRRRGRATAVPALPGAGRLAWDRR